MKSNRTYPIRHQIEQLKELEQQIRATFAQGKLDHVLKLINDYERIAYNPNLVTFKGNYYAQKSEYEHATEIFKQGLKVYPFHFDINFNIGIMYELRAMPIESYYQYLIAFRISGTEEQETLAEAAIHRLQSFIEQVYTDHQQELDDITLKAQYILAEKDFREFPLDSHQNSTIRRWMQNNAELGFMTNIYNNYMFGEMNAETRFNAMTETLPGQQHDDEHQLVLTEPSWLPVTVLDSNNKIDFDINDNVYSFSGTDLHTNYHHYLRFDEPGTLNIRMQRPLFIGQPIPIQDQPKAKKLILNIFVDGIAYKFLEQHGLENVMPATFNYFKDGMIAKHCYATSEWTYPSVATMYTGKYTTNHHVFHPEFNYDFSGNNKMMQEYFKEAGYYTAQIGGDWRITPMHGYYKGFDRILYQNFMGGMDCKKVVTEAIEHLEAFQDKNNFLWLSIGDVHHVPDEIDQNIILQTRQSISQRINRRKKGQTTVLTSYDTNKHEKYAIEIQRIDLYLNMLYNYLRSHYDEQDIVVMLHSDHGQSFLEDSPRLLNEHRRRVPFMVKGIAHAGGKVDEFIETVDFLPSVLHWAGLEPATGIDGKLPHSFGGEAARSFAFTESIHPNQTYKAAITDADYDIHFENTTPISQDGIVHLHEYCIQVIERSTGEDVTEALPAITDHYEQVIWQHIKTQSSYEAQSIG
ncbi:sulfatase-like hydrolase/transferase [Paenibacillus sp. SGZ-1009]|uniref:sulfatase-like hydrolase/transferase n=1 Tax=Paenibacillus campi TaxID=3106031 RepID=UPI002AFF1918|nr:sulfatase-like hydrolase/transferase [Paenibacillus sp. SGZ-1009]